MIFGNTYERQHNTTICFNTYIKKSNLIADFKLIAEY
jgi:hypothetical protein